MGPANHGPAGPRPRICVCPPRGCPQASEKGQRPNLASEDPEGGRFHHSALPGLLSACSPELSHAEGKFGGAEGVSVLCHPGGVYACSN